MSTEIKLGEGLSPRDRLIRAGRNPEVAWRMQSGKNANRYAEKLGATLEEYEKELGKLLKENFIHKAQSIKDTSTLLVVETRIAVPEMLEMARIGTFFDPREQKVEDWLVEESFETPRKPYVAQITYVPNKPVIDIRIDSIKQESKRGGTIFDGLALYHKDPRILSNYFLQFPGSQVGPDNVPFLFVFSDNNPMLSYGNVESTSTKYACVVASKG